MAFNRNDEELALYYRTCSKAASYLNWQKVKGHTDRETQRKSRDMTNSQSGKTIQIRGEMDGSQVQNQKTTAQEQAYLANPRVIAMTDVDPHYFITCTGRTVKEKFSVHQYVNDAREIFRTRLLADQESDECIRMEQELVHEWQRLKQTRHRYRRYVNDFERFLSKDHESSMAIMNEANAEAVSTDELAVKKNSLSKDFGRVRLQVLAWEESWRMTKMCQKFLLDVSPMSWRVKHDETLSSESEGTVIAPDSNNLFLRTKRAPEKFLSLESLIELFEEDIAAADSTRMYFEDPADLLRVFRAIEIQNLNAMIHLESLTGSMADAMGSLATVEILLKREIEEIGEAIMNLEDVIRQTEERIIELEGYADNLLEGIFRELVCSRNVLQLRIFLEDTYESCIGPNNANLESFSMMRSIEKTYETLNLELDSLPRGIVQTCEREGFIEEAKAMKEAEDAAKKFDLMHRLLASLKRIMQPVEARGRRLMYRSAPIKHKKLQESRPMRPTQKQVLYINFFTDYSPSNNHAYFHECFNNEHIFDDLNSCLGSMISEE